MKRRISGYFDAARATYAAASGVQQLAAGRCARAVPPGSYPVVLEIGAGTGNLTRPLVHRLAFRHYLALDLAPGLLAGLLAGIGLPGVTPLVADGEVPPLAPATVDLLASASAMQWYQQPERSIPANMALLRPGGRFAVSVFVAGTLAELAQASAVSGFGSVFPLRPAEFYVGLFSALPGIELRVESWSHVDWHPSARAFLESHRRTGARFTARKQPVAPARLRHFLRSYEELFGVPGQGVPATYQVLLLHGSKGE